MNAEDFAKKEPMAMPGFTVLTPKQETSSDKMSHAAACNGCGNERQTYPAPTAKEDKTKKR